MRHGHGKYHYDIIGVQKYSNGEFYDGEWRNDARSGKGNIKTIIGQYVSATGEKYVGLWENDKQYLNDKEHDSLATGLPTDEDFIDNARSGNLVDHI